MRMKNNEIFTMRVSRHPRNVFGPYRKRVFLLRLILTFLVHPYLSIINHKVDYKTVFCRDSAPLPPLKLPLKTLLRPAHPMGI